MSPLATTFALGSLDLSVWNLAERIAVTEKVAWGLLASIGLATVHIFAGKLRLAEVVPRSRWLSFAGGVSIAYTLIHLLPELEKHRQKVAAALDEELLERALYLITLLGLVCFYGLEKLAERSSKSSAESAASSSAGVFWIHILSFAAYNALIGYTLVTEERSLQSLLFFAVAIGLHFLVNDDGLRRHHRARYRHVGRWIISCAVIGGWLIGATTSISELATAAAVGFLAGGILLNVFKEEIPEERESRFWAFGLGAAIYAALLIFVER